MPCCFSWWRWRDGGGAYDGIAWPGLFMPMTISSVLGQPAGLVPRITPCWRRSWPGAWAVAAAQVGIDSAAAGGVKALGEGCTGCLGLSLVFGIEAA